LELLITVVAAEATRMTWPTMAMASEMEMALKRPTYLSAM
jgi:hypothetical protein